MNHILKPLSTQDYFSGLIEYVCGQTLPLEIVFGEAIDKEKLNGFFSSNKKHLDNVESISSEKDLIERVWHRIQIAKIKQKNDISAGDLNYLRNLILALRELMA